MKFLLIAVVMIGAVSASGQTGPSSESAGLKIVRVELQRTVVKAPSLRAVASTDPGSQAQAKADRNATADSNPALHRLSQNAEIAPKTS